MASIQLQANLRYVPSEGAPPVVIPLGFSTTFTQESKNRYKFATSITNRALDTGSVVKPTAVILEVTAGEVSFSKTVDGVNPIRLSMNVNPTPENTSKMLLFTNNPDNFPLFATAVGPCEFSVHFLS